MVKIDDQAVFNDVACASGNSVSRIVEADEVEQLKLKAAYFRKTSSYDVDVVWIDQNGNEIITESIASGVTSTGSSNVQTASVNARSNKAKVTISDESTTGSAGSGKITGIFTLV